MKEEIKKAMSELDNLIDNKSEFRWTNRAKSIKVLVNKETADFGKLVICVKRGYIEVYKKLGTYPKISCRSFGRILLNLDDPNFVSEHINGNPLDCRISNLRICKQNENNKNRKPYSLKTKYKGLNIGNDWKSVSVEIQNNFIRNRILFNQTVIEKLGAMVYDVMAIKLHGEYSRLNFDKRKYSDEMVEFIYDLIKENISQIDKSNTYTPT